MGALTGSTISSSYDMLLKTATTGGVTSTLKVIEDGLGIDSALKLSTTVVGVNGSLGIGTDAPDSILHLDGGATTQLTMGNSSAGDSVIMFKEGSDVMSLTYDGGVNSLYIRDEDSDAIRVTFERDGNVGIGGTPSTYNLEVHDSSDATISVVAGATSKASLYLGDAVATRGRIEYDNDEDGSTPDSLSLWSNNLRAITIDDSQNVGIGISVPTAKLEIAAPSSGSAFVANLLDNTADGLVVKQGSNEYLAVNTTNSSEAVVIGNITTNPETHILGGNVGIGGVPAADARLHVSGEDAVISQVSASDDNTFAEVRLESGTDDGDGKLAQYRMGVYGKSHSSLANKFSIWGGDSETGAAHRLTIDHLGKVGIGEDNPEAELHVNGGIHLPNGQYISSDQSDGTLRNVMGVDSDDNLLIGDTNYDDIRFNVGGVAPAMTIQDATGNVGIGGSWSLNADGTGSWGENDDAGAFTWDTGKAVINAQGSNSLVLKPSAADGITIDSSSNVGIGGEPNSFTNSTTLTIDGPAAGGSMIDLECNATRIASFYTNSSTDARIITHTSAPLLLGANSTPSVQIDSAGQSTFTRTTRGSNIRLELADDGALTGPLLTFYRNSASPADDDDLGKINFSGNNDAAAEASFAYIECEAKDVSAGTQDGDLIFGTVKDGSGAERIRIGSSGQLGIGGENYGTSGQVLISGGDSAAPSWTDLSNPAHTYSTSTPSGGSDGDIWFQYYS